MPLDDLDTVRDMLAGVRDSLKRVPEFEEASRLLELALAEIQGAERRRLGRLPRHLLDPRALYRRRH